MPPEEQARLDQIKSAYDRQGHRLLSTSLSHFVNLARLDPNLKGGMFERAIALHHNQNTSDKVYLVAEFRQGSSIRTIVGWGRNGSTVQSQLHRDAPEVFDKKVTEKEKKGYREFDAATEFLEDSFEPPPQPATSTVVDDVVVSPNRFMEQVRG